MTKEEVATKHLEIASEGYIINDPFGQFMAHADFTIEHTNKETERLKAELEAKDKEIERLNNLSESRGVIILKAYEEFRKAEWCSPIVEELKEATIYPYDIENKYEEKIKKLQSELNELKEKHKRDAIDFYTWMRADDSNNGIAQLYDIYKKEKFESND